MSGADVFIVDLPADTPENELAGPGGARWGGGGGLDDGPRSRRDDDLRVGPGRDRRAHGGVDRRPLPQPGDRAPPWPSTDRGANPAARRRRDRGRRRLDRGPRASCPSGAGESVATVDDLTRSRAI